MASVIAVAPVTAVLKLGVLGVRVSPRRADAGNGILHTSKKKGNSMSSTARSILDAARLKDVQMRESAGRPLRNQWILQEQDVS